MKREWSEHPAVAALREDRLRGASELARGALEALGTFALNSSARDAASLRRNVTGLATALQRARPGMPSVSGLIERWRRKTANVAPDSLLDLRRALARVAKEVAEESLEAVESIAEEVVRLVADDARVITISRSSTVARSICRLASRNVHVIVCESRPLLEGHQLALEIDRIGIESQLITEAQLGTFLGTADLAMVGADAVLADGSVVNKAGTYLLALAAREADVPFWVLSESFKRVESGAEDFPLEEMDPTALGAPVLQRCQVRNIAFDVTPAALVTRWIDEKGSSLGGPG